ncbi:auxin-responsive family protein [Artemisia annua]|uniref:Auxin-responsive family protein n=1 Tax=Artemisia annua TaxID=35608 RepID=A0A2U1QM03_ARTAN|nr:auxin-responsive family protein [Artemisia annua]
MAKLQEMTNERFKNNLSKGVEKENNELMGYHECCKENVNGEETECVELKVLDECCEKNVEGMGMKSKEVELDDKNSGTVGLGSPEDADMGGNEFVDGANGSEGNVEVVMDTVGNETSKGNGSLCLEGVELEVSSEEEGTNDGSVKGEDLELNPLSEGGNNTCVVIGEKLIGFDDKDSDLVILNELVQKDGESKEYETSKFDEMFIADMEGAFSKDMKVNSKNVVGFDSRCKGSEIIIPSLSQPTDDVYKFLTPSWKEKLKTDFKKENGSSFVDLVVATTSVEETVACDKMIQDYGVSNGEGLRNVKKSGIVAVVKLYQKGRQKEDFEKGIGADKRKSIGKEMCHVKGLVLKGVCAYEYVGIRDVTEQEVSFERVKYDIWKWPKKKKMGGTQCKVSLSWHSMQSEAEKIDMWKWPRRKKEWVGGLIRLKRWSCANLEIKDDLESVGCLGKYEFLSRCEFLRGVGFDNEKVSMSLPNEKKSVMKGCLGKAKLMGLVTSIESIQFYTSSVNDYGTELQLGVGLSCDESRIRGELNNGDVVVYSSSNFPGGRTSFAHEWRVGPVRNVVGKVYFATGEGGEEGGVGGTLRHRRNTLGVLNIVSWGVMMPTGFMAARYFKVFKRASRVWFYIRVTCQVSAYIFSAAGWVTGIKLCSDSTGIEYTHIDIGIALKVTTHKAIIAHGNQVEPWAERSISNVAGY